MIRTALDIQQALGSFITLVPFVTGIIFVKRLESGMKILVLAMAAAAAAEISSYLLSTSNMNFYWVHHIYLPVEYTLFSLILSKWVRNKFISGLIRYSIPFFVVLCILNTLFLQPIYDANSNVITLAFIIYTLTTLIILFQIMTGESENIMKNHVFWVATGLLLFSAGDLAYFAFHSLIEEHYLVAIWSIHSILNTMSYIFYFVGFICQGRKWT